MPCSSPSFSVCPNGQSHLICSFSLLESGAQRGQVLGEKAPETPGGDHWPPGVRVGVGACCLLWLVLSPSLRVAHTAGFHWARLAASPLPGLGLVPPTWTRWCCSRPSSLSVFFPPFPSRRCPGAARAHLILSVFSHRDCPSSPMSPSTVVFVSVFFHLSFQ